MVTPTEVSVSRLSVRYPGASREALKDVCLHLEGGRVVGLLGENGAGKSTLMHAVAGVIAPTSGEVSVRCERMGWCSQRPMIDWFVSVRTNVWLGARLGGARGAEAWQRADKALAAVGLDTVDPDETPEALSGGQQQRLMIARVLAMKADFMILDEPTVGLDLSNVSRLKQAVLAARDAGGLVLISSHDFTVLDGLVDEIVLVHQGELRFHGAPQEFMKRYVTHEVIELDLDREASAELVRDCSRLGETSAEHDRLRLRLPLGNRLADVLSTIEQAGFAVVDLRRAGVDLAQAFQAALEEEK